MSGRNVAVRVERLVLHGVDALDQEALGRAIQAELARLLAGGGEGGAGTGVEALGRQVARELRARLGGEAP